GATRTNYDRIAQRDEGYRLLTRSNLDYPISKRDFRGFATGSAGWTKEGESLRASNRYMALLVGSRPAIQPSLTPLRPLRLAGPSSHRQPRRHTEDDRLGPRMPERIAAIRRARRVCECFGGCSGRR